jgi:type II secretory pathway pseudopilin PulG
MFFQSTGEEGDTMNKKEKGYSLIELMFVMMLLVLFGLTTFTLVISGSNTYKRLTESKNENSELRVAISYVKMEIRQNDTRNSMSIRKNFTGNGNSNDNALVIDKTTGKESYEKWIYCSKGKLKEAYVKKGELPKDDLSIEVATISSFDVEFSNNGKGINIRVSKAFGSGDKSYSSVIALNTVQ